jgi:hypothetical protein
VLGIDATAAVLGHASWLEARCFEILGAWVPLVPEPDVKLLVARHSRHHGGHAVLLAELVPTTRAHDPGALVAPSDDRWAQALTRVAGDAATATLDRLVGAYQVVLPAMVAGYDETLSRTGPWSDGPVARGLRRVVDDERSDLAEGLGCLEDLLDADGAVDRAARRRAEVEQVLPPWRPSVGGGSPGR